MLNWLYNTIQIRHSVSIIVPTRKNTKFLLESINSLLVSAKKCSKFEILLGIDNCYDTLNFLIDKSIKLDPKINIYFFPKNVGPYVIRNTLIEKSKYDYILLFDSDDILIESALHTILNALIQYNIVKFKFYNFQDGKDYNDKSNLKLASMYAHGAFAIRKECYYELRGFYGWKCGADTEFMERYEARGYICCKIETPLFYRRFHEDNITKNKETGINSEFREKFRQYIYDNRKTMKWDSPKKIETSSCNRIILKT